MDNTTILTQNPTYTKKDLLYTQMKGVTDFVLDSAKNGTPAHLVETELWCRILQIGHHYLALFFKECGNVDMGEKIENTDSRILKRLANLHRRPYLSIFGHYELERYVYGSREGQKIEYIPFDSQLQLPEIKFSYVLQDWDQSLAVENHYAKVNETIERMLGFSQPIDSLERINRKMSEEVKEFWQTQSVPPT